LDFGFVSDLGFRISDLEIYYFYYTTKYLKF